MPTIKDYSIKIKGLEEEFTNNTLITKEMPIEVLNVVGVLSDIDLNFFKSININKINDLLDKNLLYKIKNHLFEIKEEIGTVVNCDFDLTI